MAVDTNIYASLHAHSTHDVMYVDAFTMEIAGLSACVQPMFESTREYCRPYLSCKEPTLFVQVTEQDLTFEQKLLDIEAEEEGMKRRKFTDPFLERTAIQRKVADHLLGKNTLMLHGSTVAVDGKAYLFTGPCGVGKSTHTRLWRELFSDRAIMVNDDKPFLQMTSDGVLAYGSPWSGKHGLASNICVPLQGICFLRRGSENAIRPAAPADCVQILRHQAHMPTDPVLAEQAAALVDRLAEKVPLWEMTCNKDMEAARVSYQAMSVIR